jgi:spermidine synthase
MTVALFYVKIVARACKAGKAVIFMTCRIKQLASSLKIKGLIMDINDAAIYQEMLIHPAIFSHFFPQKIAIIGDVNCHLLEEALKHETLTEIWEITPYLSQEPPKQANIHYYDNLPTLPADHFDIIVTTENYSEDAMPGLFNALLSDGVLVQLGDSPFNVASLRAMQIHLQLIGFRDVHILSFPQPSYSTGWRAAIMAKKNSIFKRVREKAIFNKNFSTQYYNLDVHKGSLVIPEFMREALTI